MLSVEHLTLVSIVTVDNTRSVQRKHTLVEMFSLDAFNVERQVQVLFTTLFIYYYFFISIIYAHYWRHFLRSADVNFSVNLRIALCIGVKLPDSTRNVNSIKYMFKNITFIVMGRVGFKVWSRAKALDIFSGNCR